MNEGPNQNVNYPPQPPKAPRMLIGIIGVFLVIVLVSLFTSGSLYSLPIPTILVYVLLTLIILFLDYLQSRNRQGIGRLYLATVLLSYGFLLSLVATKLLVIPYLFQGNAPSCEGAFNYDCIAILPPFLFALLISIAALLVLTSALKWKKFLWSGLLVFFLYSLLGIPTILGLAREIKDAKQKKVSETTRITSGNFVSFDDCFSVTNVEAWNKCVDTTVTTKATYDRCQYQSGALFSSRLGVARETLEDRCTRAFQSSVEDCFKYENNTEKQSTCMTSFAASLSAAEFFLYCYREETAPPKKEPTCDQLFEQKLGPMGQNRDMSCGSVAKKYPFGNTDYSIKKFKAFCATEEIY